MGYVESVNISVSNSDQTRDNVPDYPVHMDGIYIDDSGAPHTFDVDRYFLIQINWLINNHPQVAKRVFSELAYKIERVRQPNLDDVSQLL